MMKSETTINSMSTPSESSHSMIQRAKHIWNTYPFASMMVALLTLRVGFVLASPVDLIADESYYWDWSRRLDIGYYSKPPMIAWINWLSTSMLGANEFAVRLPAALFGTLGLIWVYLLGARMFSYRVGFISAALLALTPGQTALSFLMTIDAPFLFFWAASLYGFWRLINEERGWQWPAFTALMLGLGLLSKQTTLGFFPLAGIYFLLTPGKRHLWGSLRVWGTAAVSLLFLTPVLVWNIQHDWITLEHTASHFSEHSTTWMTQFARFGEFFLGQIGVVSPVLWGAIAITGYVAARNIKRLTPEESYLFCFSIIPLLAIFALSATRRLEPNWPAACYPAAVILTTAALLGRSSLSDLISNRQIMLSRSWKTAAVFSLGTYLAITVVPASPLAGSPLDITCRLRGWKELASQMETIVRKSETPAGDSPLIITTAGRDITSALAFYLPENPLIPFWSQDDAGIQCQYDLWPRPEVDQVTSALVVTEVDPQLPESLEGSFSNWKLMGTIEVALGGKRKREYQVYQTKHFGQSSLLRTAKSPSEGVVR